MKVLFFTNIPSPYRVDFFNELGKHCDLTVLYERCDADDRASSWLKGEGNLHFKAVFLKGKKIGADTALCFSACKYWKDKSYDLRIVGDYASPTGMLSIAYMRLKGIPYGVEIDGGYVKEEKGYVKAIKKWFLSRCAFAFSPGKTSDLYLENYGVSQDRIHFYPFTSMKEEDIAKGADYFGKKELYKKKLGMKEEKVVLSVGQMIPRKGFDCLLEAKKALPAHVGLYIVGGTPPAEYLRYVEENDLQNVHFVDFKSKSALAEYYAAADLFALPTREDIWGLVISEAMGYGLPVITTDKCVAGVELVAQEGGAIIGVDEPDRLAAEIERLLNEEEALACGRRNLARIKEYTIENMAAHHSKAFSVLKDRITNGQ